MKNKNKWRKMLFAGLSMVITVTLLAGCLPSSGEGEEQERVLRIAVMDSYGRSYFDHIRSQYTDLYQFSRQDVEVEFVSAVDRSVERYDRDEEEEERPDPVEEMKKLLQSESPPDLVMLQYNELPSLVDDNLLAPLDPLIQESGFETEGIVPAVLEGLKNAGNGQLYALSPTFSSSALVYNMDIFEEAGVNYPTDMMTWDEVFNLARQISDSMATGDEPVYGFSFSPRPYSDLYEEMRYYTTPLDLRMFDENEETMLVNSEPWKNVWSKMVELQKQKVFYERNREREMKERENNEFNPFRHQPFFAGEIAMTIMNQYEVNELINTNKNAHQIEGFDGIRWDVATVPIHEGMPVSSEINMFPVMGINAKAQNRDDAWDFIQFINGDRWAELKSQSINNMVSREAYIEPVEGLSYNVSAFYKLPPSEKTRQHTYEIYRDKPNLRQIEFIGRRYFQQVLEEEMTVDEALQQWETEGNSALQQIKENPDGPIRTKDSSSNTFEIVN